MTTATTDGAAGGELKRICRQHGLKQATSDGGVVVVVVMVVVVIVMVVVVVVN